MLFTADYDTPLAWQAVQAAAPGRVTVCSGLPGWAGKAKPSGNGMRVDILPGDLTATGTYSAPRSEVFGRLAVPTTTPLGQWPDPVGSTRWYDWSLLVPTGFQYASNPADPAWLLCTQWKGLNGGSPPVSVDIKNNWLRLGGTRTNQGLVPHDGNLGLIKQGTWTRLQVGLCFSPDPAVGWVQVVRDGVEVLPRTPLATVDLINGQPDPVYVKQGIYRDVAWTCPHTLYYGPLTISAELASLAH